MKEKSSKYQMERCMMNRSRHLSAVENIGSSVVVVPFNGPKILQELDEVGNDPEFFIQTKDVASLYELNQKMENYFQQVRQMLLETEVQIHGDKIVSNNTSLLAFLKQELGIVQPKKSSFLKRILTFFLKCVKTRGND